jgi:hypothetical protein
MAAGVHLCRYYNQQLQPLYNKANPTPASATYHVQKLRLESGYRQAHTLIKTPVQPLVGSLKANTFWPLTIESSSQLVPPRPYYARWPTNGKKRKMNAMAQKGVDLPEGIFYQSLKIRLHPSEAQRPVLRQWFAAARLFGNRTTASAGATSACSPSSSAACSSSTYTPRASSRTSTAEAAGCAHARARSAAGRPCRAVYLINVAAVVFNSALCTRTRARPPAPNFVVLQPRMHRCVTHAS